MRPFGRIATGIGRRGLGYQRCARWLEQRPRPISYRWNSNNASGSQSQKTVPNSPFVKIGHAVVATIASGLGYAFGAGSDSVPSISLLFGQRDEKPKYGTVKDLEKASMILFKITTISQYSGIKKCTYILS